MTFSTLRTITAATAAVAVPVGLAALITVGAQAQVKKPVVDRGHTSVHFSVMHGGVSPTNYQFRQIKTVEFVFDPDDVSKSKITLVIDAASLDSNHYFRDSWARTEQELNVWKFPTIKFVSTKVEKTGDNTGKITGDLTLRGVTKEVTADIVHRGTKHFSGKHMVHGFVASGSFKRSDFGLKAFTPWIGDEIKFQVIVEQKRPLPATAKK